MPLINFSGIASGIDSNALIEALTTATRKQRITPSQDKIDELTEANASLDELDTKFAALKDKASDFTTLNGGALVKSAESSDETAVTATATGLATNGTYTVSVSTIAKNSTGSFNDRFASDSTIVNSGINNGDPAGQRTLTVSIGTGAELETTSIVLTNTTTWGEVAASFNASSSKGEASIVNVGTVALPSYALFFSTNNEGTSKGSLTLSAGTSITGSPPGAMTAQSTNAATDATFTISGINGTITRDSNKVTGVIPGVTFNLEKASSTATISIGDDVAATTGKVQELVDTYNEIVQYIATNNTITREENGQDVKNTFGALAKTSVDNNSLTALRSAIAEAVYSSGSSVRILADIGISTERDGTLKFDTDKFETAMSEEPQSVGQVLTTFTEDISLTNGVIDQFIQFNGLFDLSINANKTQISNLNDRIGLVEQQIARTEETQRARFARLESTIGRLNQQQSALNSALAGLR